MLKRGRLSKKEISVIDNDPVKDAVQLAKRLKRAQVTIEKYLANKEKTDVSQENQSVKPKSIANSLFIRSKPSDGVDRGYVIMTPTASQAGDESNKSIPDSVKEMNRDKIHIMDPNGKNTHLVR